MCFNSYTNSSTQTSSLALFYFIYFLRNMQIVLRCTVFYEEEEHGHVLDYFSNWFEKSNLLLNWLKQGKKCIDFRKEKNFVLHFDKWWANTVGHPNVNILAVFLTISYSRTYGLTIFAPSLYRKLLTFHVNSNVLLFFNWKHLCLWCYLLVCKLHTGTTKVKSDKS